MSTASILLAAERIFTAIINALADGKIDRVEAHEIRKEAMDELSGFREGISLTEVVDHFVGLFNRTTKELLDAADRAEARGNVQRAARLRSRAERRG